MIREQGIIVSRKTLDSFQTRKMALQTGQEAVIVGETRSRKPVGPYVKILCSEVFGTPFLSLEVRARLSNEVSETNILRVGLELDDEGNVVGLKDDVLHAWLDYGDKNYLLSYQVDPEKPDTAELAAVSIRVSEYGGYSGGYREVVDQANLPFDPAELGYPRNVDLIGTFDIYLDEQPLTVDAILAQPLVPAAV